MFRIKQFVFDNRDEIIMNDIINFWIRVSMFFNFDFRSTNIRISININDFDEKKNSKIDDDEIVLNENFDESHCHKSKKTRLNDFNEKKNSKINDDEIVLNENFDESHRHKSKKSRLNVLTIAVSTISFESRIYKKVMKQIDSVQWQNVIEKKMQDIIINNVFELVNFLSNKRAVTTKWIYKKKFESNENVIKYKIRLIIRNDFQKENIESIDFNETYFEIVKFVFYRILFALIVTFEWFFH